MQDIIDIPPPVASAGRWVRREEFFGKKSFGSYECKCGNEWTSAHAFKVYKQGCKRCERKILPKFMWRNLGENIVQRADKDKKKPHHKGRCEACKLGVCTNDGELVLKFAKFSINEEN